MPRLTAGLFDIATEELADALAQLTAQQIAAIHRIVIVEEHTTENPPAPYRLLHGPDKMVSETTWNRRPKVDPETGELKIRPGWTHQPAFMAALNLAKRTKRRHMARAMIEHITEAYATSAEAAPAVTVAMVEIATAEQTDPETGEKMPRFAEDKDRIAAARLLAPQWEALRKEAREEDPAGDEKLDDWIAALDDLEDE